MTLHDCTDSQKKDVGVVVTGAVLCCVYCICSSPEKHGGLLLELLHQLVELAQTGGDGVAVEAGRCLGMIGCVDIGLVTPHGRHANLELATVLSAVHDSAKMQQYCHMFHALCDYLIDSELVHLSTSLVHLSTS